MDIIILVVACSVNLALGFFVLIHDRKAGFARSFALMSVLICAWVIANYVNWLSDFQPDD